MVYLLNLGDQRNETMNVDRFNGPVRRNAYVFFYARLGKYIMTTPLLRTDMPYCCATVSKSLIRQSRGWHRIRSNVFTRLFIAHIVLYTVSNYKHNIDDPTMATQGFADTRR